MYYVKLIEKFVVKGILQYIGHQFFNHLVGNLVFYDIFLSSNFDYKSSNSIYLFIFLFYYFYIRLVWFSLV